MGIPSLRRRVEHPVGCGTRVVHTILLGGVNYREQASHWPSAQGELAEIMNTVEKVVFSKTLGEDEVKWQNARLAKGKPAGEIRRLRDRPGDRKVAVAGGATLVRSLTEEGLIDEYRLLIHPLALGEGLSIFSRPVKLELIHSRPLQSGVVVNGYRRVA